MPVKFQAAISLSKMLNNETAVEFLKPALQSILEVYLRIMEEIDSEVLVDALQEIMECYDDQISPFAVQLSQQLTNKYQSLIQEMSDVVDDDAE